MGEGILTRREPGTVTAEDGALYERIADAVGTPVYAYDARFIRAQYQQLVTALAPVPHRIHYSVKANSSGAVLRLLRDLGAGVDIVSGGELQRVLAAGFTGPDVVFSGVGKAPAELHAALEARILFFNVESAGELVLLDAMARERGVIAPVALRVNPEVTVDTPHPYTRTGEKGMKFGIPIDEAVQAAELAQSLPAVELVGLDMHLGSQIASAEPYGLGLERLIELLHQCRASGSQQIEYLDVGGGFAVTYEGEEPIELGTWAATVLPLVETTGLKLIVEPGRWLVANAGVLLTRVLYRKRSGGREFVVLDAGMTDLLRPALYNAYHAVEVIGRVEGEVTADLVGPVCESGDFLAIGRRIADVAPGDLLAIRGAGAYGYAMASNYNSRPRPAEVMTDGGRFAVVTRRETVADLMVREVEPPVWRTR